MDDNGLDPAVTNPELFKVVFENERVRVVEYRDRPDDQTMPHRHPDSLMFVELKDPVPAPPAGDRLGPESG